MTNASNTVNFRLMGNPSTVHCICKNHFICAGNNGTAKANANITVCSLERRKEQNLVGVLSSIMGNGHFSGYMGSRSKHFIPFEFAALSSGYHIDLNLYQAISVYLQEPASVVFSALNLSVQFHGWLSFFILVYYKLPLKPNRGTFYDYTGLWHIYGLLSMNSWFWSAVFHSR